MEGVEETNDHVDPIFRDLVATTGREDQSITLGSLPTKVENSPTGFLELWKHLCYAATPDDFVAAWVKILEDFSQQDAIISYLQTIYLPFRHQWATCFTRQYRNFGVKVTSRTEASHKEIKSYLRNTFADLLFLAQRIKQLVTDCERAFKAREAEEAVRMVRDHQKHLWLGNMRAKLSRKAVSLVIQQREIVIKALKSNPSNANPLRPCTRQFSEQFGLPCSHKIYELLLQNQALDFTMADPHWHLTRDRAADDRYLGILDPLLSVPRGRPTNGHVNIPPEVTARGELRYSQRLQREQSRQDAERAGQAETPLRSQNNVRQAAATCRRQPSH